MFSQLLSGPTSSHTSEPLIKLTRAELEERIDEVATRFRESCERWPGLAAQALNDFKAKLDESTYYDVSIKNRFNDKLPELQKQTQLTEAASLPTSEEIGAHLHRGGLVAGKPVRQRGKAYSLLVRYQQQLDSIQIDEIQVFLSKKDPHATRPLREPMKAMKQLTKDVHDLSMEIMDLNELYDEYSALLREQGQPHSSHPPSSKALSASAPSSHVSHSRRPRQSPKVRATTGKSPAIASVGVALLLLSALALACAIARQRLLKR